MSKREETTWILYYKFIVKSSWENQCFKTDGPFHPPRFSSVPSSLSPFHLAISFPPFLVRTDFPIVGPGGGSDSRWPRRKARPQEGSQDSGWEEVTILDSSRHLTLRNGRMWWKWCLQPLRVPPALFSFEMTTAVYGWGSIRRAFLSFLWDLMGPPGPTDSVGLSTHE